MFILNKVILGLWTVNFLVNWAFLPTPITLLFNIVSAHVIEASYAISISFARQIFHVSMN